MKDKPKFGLEHIAAGLVGLLIAAGTAVYIALPWIVEYYVDLRYVALKEQSYKAILSSLYCAGIPVIVMLVFALLLSLNICRGKAFVNKNVRYMNIMSLCSLLSGLVFLVSMFFLRSIFPIIIFVIFLLLAVFVKIFANLFRKAVSYKEENELTI